MFRARQIAFTAAATGVLLGAAPTDEPAAAPIIHAGGAHGQRARGETINLRSRTGKTVSLCSSSQASRSAPSLQRARSSVCTRRGFLRNAQGDVMSWVTSTGTGTSNSVSKSKITQQAPFHDEPSAWECLVAHEACGSFSYNDATDQLECRSCAGDLIRTVRLTA